MLYNAIHLWYLGEPQTDRKVNTHEILLLYLLYHFDDYLLFYLFRGFNTSKRIPNQIDHISVAVCLSPCFFHTYNYQEYPWNPMKMCWRYNFDVAKQCKSQTTCKNHQESTMFADFCRAKNKIPRKSHPNSPTKLDPATPHATPRCKEGISLSLSRNLWEYFCKGPAESTWCRRKTAVCCF